MRILSPAVVLMLAFVLPVAGQGADFGVRKEPVTERQARWLSVVYPGLGQLVAGHRTKGTTLIAATTASLVVWLTSHADYNTHNEQFDLETARYLSLREDGSYAQAEQSWARLRDRKDDLDRSHNLRQLFGAAAIGLYAYNVVDAFLLGGVAPADAEMALLPDLSRERPGVALVTRFR